VGKNGGSPSNGQSGEFVIPPQKDRQILGEDESAGSSIPVASGGQYTRPYTKYFRPGLYPKIPSNLSFLDVHFEPLSFAHKYGFLAVGGERGIIAIYCTMGSTGRPVQIAISNIR